MNNIYFWIAMGTVIISSFSQILLKKGSQIETKSIIKQYINPYVIIGYAMTFFCMILMIIAYKGIPYKQGPVIESLAYIYILVLSRIFIKEKITHKKIVGIVFIVIGVVVFTC